MANDRRLGVYLATVSLTRVATEAASPAVMLVTIAILGSAADGSYLMAALTGSAAIAGPVVGTMLDRAPHPRRFFAVAMALFGLGLALLAELVGRAPLALLVVVALVTGIGYPVLTGAWTAQLPALLPADQLPRAYSADAGTYSLAAIVGPPLASLLLVLSARAPLWLPAVALALSIVVLRSLPLAPRHGARSSVVVDMRRGIAAIVRRPALRKATLMTTVSFAGQAAIFIGAPLIAQANSGSLAMTGVILGAIAVGGVITASVLVRRPVQAPDRLVTIATAVSGVGLAIVGLAPNLAVAVVGAFVLGAAEAPQMTSVFFVRNREAPADVRAQVFTTAASLRITAFAAGSAVFGAMLGLGVGAVMAAGVAMHAIAVLAGLAVGPRRVAA